MKYLTLSWPLLLLTLAMPAHSAPKFDTQFKLTSHDNRVVTRDTFKGKFLMVFFGFTNCGSVCPLGLSTIAKVLTDVKGSPSKVQALFISVDPDRDNVAQLKSYLATYNSPILGLRGSEAELTPILKGYRAYSQKIESPDPKFYLMDHSDLIYILDPQGKYLAHFSSADGYKKISAYLQKQI